MYSPIIVQEGLNLSKKQEKGRNINIHAWGIWWSL